MKTKSDPYLISPELVLTLNDETFPLEYLYRHLLIVGQPGSGKTRSVLMPLLQEILVASGNDNAKKPTLIVFDPKNELGIFLKSVAEKVGRSEDLIFFSPGSAVYNPLSNPFFTEAEAIEKIVLYGGHSNRAGGGRSENEAFWANAQRALLGAVVAISRALHDVLTYEVLNGVFDRINQFPTGAAAADWLNDLSVSAAVRQAVNEFLKLPSESTRPCVATSVSNVLFCWKAEPLLSLTTPRSDLPEIDPFQIIDAGKILIIGCATAAYGASITPLMLALKEHFFTSILSRDQIEVESDEGVRPINQERPVFVVGDEFQSYLTANSNAGELVALDRMRSARAGYLAATQNLASIFSVMNGHAHASRLISLFSNQIHLSNTCPYTAQHASTLMGTKVKKVVQYSSERQMAPPLLIDRQSWPTRVRRKRSGVVIPQTVPRVDASALATLKTGEYWFRLASGKVCKGKAKALV